MKTMSMDETRQGRQVMDCQGAAAHHLVFSFITLTEVFATASLAVAAAPMFLPPELSPRMFFPLLLAPRAAFASCTLQVAEAAAEAVVEAVVEAGAIARLDLRWKTCG